MTDDGEHVLALADEFQPQIVILDIGMPIVGGYEAATELRNTEWGQRLKLVALTGWGQDSDSQRTKEAHFDFHLVKPAGIEQIQRILSQIEGAGF